MAKVTFGDVGKRISAKQLGIFEQLLCPVYPFCFPADYRRFLLKYNGGRPEPSHFKWRVKKTNEESEVHEFLGLDPDSLEEPSILRTTLIYRSKLPQYALPIAWLELDDLLLLFTAGPREGQVWHWSSSHPKVDGWDFDPESNITLVARSFSAFMKLLYRLVVADPYQPVTIALDTPRVRGKQLAATLESLGCKPRKLPAGCYSDPPRLPAWHWPKYRNTRDPGGPAFLEIEKNKTEGYAPKFDQRPMGHKMLQVSVTKLQRAACLRELTEALGPGAVVLGSD